MPLLMSWVTCWSVPWHLTSRICMLRFSTMSVHWIISRSVLVQAYARTLGLRSVWITPLFGSSTFQLAEHASPMSSSQAEIWCHHSSWHSMMSKLHSYVDTMSRDSCATMLLHATLSESILIWRLCWFCCCCSGILRECGCCIVVVPIHVRAVVLDATVAISVCTGIEGFVWGSGAEGLLACQWPAGSIEKGAPRPCDWVYLRFVSIISLSQVPVPTSEKPSLLAGCVCSFWF